MMPGCSCLVKSLVSRRSHQSWLQFTHFRRQREHCLLQKSFTTSATHAQRITSDIDKFSKTGLQWPWPVGVNSSISESTIIVQEGHEIQELPVVVITTNDTDSCQGSQHGTKMEPGKAFIPLDPKEEEAFIQAFNGYHSPRDVLRVLDTIPSQEVTPMISYCVLKKLFELENNFGFRNQGRSWMTTSENGTQETFARAAIVDRLVNTIVGSENAKLMLDTLELLRRDNQAYAYMGPDEVTNYRLRLCYRTLVSVTTGKFSLSETCRAVSIIGKMKREENFTIGEDFIDKMWTGIYDKKQDLDVNNIADVFECVFYFKKSQRLVCNLLESNLVTLWWRLDVETVANICDVIKGQLTVQKSRPLGTMADWCITGKMLMALSRCTALNMYQISEDQFLRILDCFMVRNYCDNSIQQALRKYMKAKSLKITNNELFYTVATYAKNFRLRIPEVLESLENYVLDETRAKTPPQLTACITYFGHVNYLPHQGVRFWSIVESYLDEKFVQFPSRDVLDIFLSCLYLGKHPLNFVDKLFSPYFLDRIHGSESEKVELMKVRRRLKLLDMALLLDCGSKYPGPLLPREFSPPSFTIDGRIPRTVGALMDPLLDACKKNYVVQSMTYLPGIPLLDSYRVDILLSPENHGEFFVSNYIKTQYSMCRSAHVEKTAVCWQTLPSHMPIKALIIHLPEHYCQDGKTLIGSEQMRLRHFRGLGIHVVSVRFEDFNKVKNSQAALKSFVRGLLGDLQLNL